MMHWVETETRVDTHVEGPTHHPEGRTDLASMPLDTFIGEATVLRFDSLAPIDGRPRSIDPSTQQAVRKNDIVLMWSPFDEKSCPCISAIVARYLAGLPVNMVGIEGSGWRHRDRWRATAVPVEGDTDNRGPNQPRAGQEG